MSLTTSSIGASTSLYVSTYDASKIADPSTGESSASTTNSTVSPSSDSVQSATKAPSTADTETATKTRLLNDLEKTLARPSDSENSSGIYIYLATGQPLVPQAPAGSQLNTMA